MTKREIIYAVFEKLNIHSDDTRLSEELVSSLIDTKRAMLLKQQYAKSSWHMPIEIKQEICVDISLVDRVDGYSCAGKILSTNIALPRSIKIKGKEGPLSVRKEDGMEINISIVAIERIPFLFENKYTQHLIYCAVDFSGKLFIISKDNKLRFLKSIKITDIFESPDEARNYSCNLDNSIEAWDDQYPMESAMVDIAVDLVVKELTRSLSIPGDNVNDSSDGR
tara:strand:+ start:11010 stop:11678 length:669 start_codon:yes stop_codon:yes gene_type:complete